MTFTFPKYLEKSSSHDRHFSCTARNELSNQEASRAAQAELITSATYISRNRSPGQLWGTHNLWFGRSKGRGAGGGGGGGRGMQGR